MADLLVHGGTVVNGDEDGGARRRRRGRAHFGSGSPRFSRSSETDDRRDRLPRMPGGVDPHVHYSRGPGGRLRRARGDRGRRPSRDPDDQDVHDVRVDGGRRLPLRRDERGRRERRHEPRARGGRRDRDVADEEVRAGGQDTRRLHRRDPQPLVEDAAVRRAMLLAERSGSPLYVLHVAAVSAVRALAQGRARGLPFYAETITPYLSFTRLLRGMGAARTGGDERPSRFRSRRAREVRRFAERGPLPSARSRRT